MRRHLKPVPTGNPVEELLSGLKGRDAVAALVRDGYLRPAEVIDENGSPVKGYTPTVKGAVWFGVLPISEPMKDRATYLVRVTWPGHYSGHLHNEWAERETARATFDQTVEDLMDGQIEHPRQVVAFDLASGRAWDASRDIAQEMIRRADPSGRPLQGHALDFVEEHVGIRAARLVAAE